MMNHSPQKTIVNQTVSFIISLVSVLTLVSCENFIDPHIIDQPVATKQYVLGEGEIAQIIKKEMTFGSNRHAIKSAENQIYQLLNAHLKQAKLSNLNPVTYLNNGGTGVYCANEVCLYQGKIIITIANLDAGHEKITRIITDTFVVNFDVNDFEATYDFTVNSTIQERPFKK